MNPKISDIRIDKLKLKSDKRDFCDSCHELATKLVKYQVGNKEQRIIRLEKYCHKHF